MMNRRQALFTSLFGAGCVGLRALATGLPASFLVNPRKALADTPAPTCGPSNAKAQYVLFATSYLGDPINPNVPGMYGTDPDLADIVHCTTDEMAPTQLKLSGTAYTAAKPWAALPQAVLDRTTFWHLMTKNPIHPKEPDVLKLMGATTTRDMFPSILSKHLAGCLNTLQAQPLSIGAVNPTEALSYGGAALPVLPPTAVKTTLMKGLLSQDSSLAAKRDSTLDEIYAIYRNEANPAQRAYIDSLITSRTQAAQIKDGLLSTLATIDDNGLDSQFAVAMVLFQMKATPVIAIHMPFGGDNHGDSGLKDESAQTVASLSSLQKFWQGGIPSALTDQVSIVSLNTFGRSVYGANRANGRDHNAKHQVSFAMGKPFRGSVVGGVTKLATDNDYSALSIDSASGKGVADGDIEATDTLGSFACTMLAAFGIAPSVIASEIKTPTGKVVNASLATS